MLFYLWYRYLLVRKHFKDYFLAIDSFKFVKQIKNEKYSLARLRKISPLKEEICTSRVGLDFSFSPFLPFSFFLSLALFHSTFRPFLFACAAGEVNSGRVCLHFHCLVSVCGLLVVVVAVVASTVIVTADAVVVDVDVDNAGTLREYKRARRERERDEKTRRRRMIN